MGVPPATVQPILRHSSISVSTGTYVEVIEAVQRDAPNAAPRSASALSSNRGLGRALPVSFSGHEFRVELVGRTDEQGPERVVGEGDCVSLVGDVAV